MANSKFEYVKSFENEEKLDNDQWIVLRLWYVRDFTEICSLKSLKTLSCLSEYMSEASKSVIREMTDIRLGYNYNTVANFVLDKTSTLYKRRSFKLLTNIVSLFTANLAIQMSKGTKKEFSHIPMFESHLYQFPFDQQLRNYLTKEQTLCHQTNLKLTTLTNLVETANMNFEDASKKVEDSNESELNELLFQLCHKNYNNEPRKLRKGAIFSKKENDIFEMHKDFHSHEFWNDDFRLNDETVLNARSSNLKYVHKKHFILPHSWLVVRLDGKAFHKFSELHNFTKPNDVRSLHLMSACAREVMKNFPFIFLSYGQSDEYSFLIKRYGHREKEGFSLVSRIISIFSESYVSLWGKYFGKQTLLSCPSFDARLVLYPTNSSLRDYLSWRQADCHINNMYNTCFWNLVNVKGLNRKDAQEYLKGTFSKDKLDILRKEFNIDYNSEDDIYCKGTVLTIQRDQIDIAARSEEGISFVEENVDLINDNFWVEKPWLLGKEFKPRENTES